MKLRLFLAFVFVAASTINSSTQAALRTVALTGQQAPGAPAGSNFVQLTAIPASAVGPALNNAGRVSFVGGSQIGAGALSRGIWSDATGALAAVAREGTPAPGAPDVNFVSFGNPVLNDASRVAFDATLNSLGSSNTGVWSQGTSGLNLIARRGSAAPGAGAGVNFGTFFGTSFGDGGATAFRAAVTGASVTAANDDGVWAEKGGTLTLIARGGSQAAGAAAGVNYENFPATPILINRDGAIAFRAFLTGAGVTPANDLAVWVDRSGAVSLIAREGDAVPGVAGASLSFIGDPVLNANGRVAFAGLMSGVPAASNAAVFSESRSSLAVAARKGNAAPGTPAGVNFNGFGSPLLNDDGQVAFTATLAGAGVTAVNDTGVWSQRGGELNLVAREGTQAPGVTDGLTFSTFTNPVFNSVGQMAFTATLAGGGIVPGNDGGIWVQGLAGDLRLVAREGEPLEVSPGVNRTIAELVLAGGVNNEDGRRTGFNDVGELAFMAKFTDGSSGIFVSDVAKASPGDFDGDADVDGADFLIWQRGLGITGTATAATGDANADGNVDAADLAIWKTKFAAPPTTANASAIPEPATLVLGIFATSAVACISRVSRSRPS